MTHTTQSGVAPSDTRQAQLPGLPPFVVPPGAGLSAPIGLLGTIHKVPTRILAGRLAIVEHTLPPLGLGAPVHRHTREDELSIVLEGQIGAMLGDDVLTATAGSYVLKPRGQWHTFWNASKTEELRFIELILPGGFDIFFERVARVMASGEGPDSPAAAALCQEYGLEFDFAATGAVIERFGVRTGG